jgi:serine/threonine protein kinase
LRKLLRRFVDVCNAIDYAHTRGVLHRDIKPGNVIVGKHGETLVVDWGLAKVLRKDEGGRMKDEKNPVQVSHFSQASTTCAWIGDSAGCRARRRKLRRSEYSQLSAVVLRQNELRPGVGPSAAAGRHAWFGTNRNGVSFFPISED